MSDNAVNIPAGTTVRLRNVRVLDVKTGTVMPAGTLVTFRDGEITEVSARESDTPVGLELDLGGRWLMPGLINTHAHVKMTLPSFLASLRDLRQSRRHAARQVQKSLADCLARGVTSVRDAWTQNLASARKLRTRIHAGEMVGPCLSQSVLVSPLGGAFAKELSVAERLLFKAIGMPIMPYESAACGSVVFRPEATLKEVRDAVDRAVEERGADTIKVYDQRELSISYRPGAAMMSQEQLDALVDQARRRGRPVTMHHLTVESFRRGLRAGVTSLAHVPYDTELTEEDLRVFVDASGIIEPTLSIAYHLCFPWPKNPLNEHPRLRALVELRAQTHEAMARQFWLPELSGAVVRGVNKASCARFRMIGFLSMSHVVRYYNGIIATGVANLARLHDAGAAIACGNDAGAVPVTAAMVGLELRLLRQFVSAAATRPFSAADALRAATVQAAQALAQAESIGVIEPGRRADLALLEQNPLESPDILGAEVAALFQAGQLTVNRCGLTTGPSQALPDRE